MQNMWPIRMHEHLITAQLVRKFDGPAIFLSSCWDHECLLIYWQSTHAINRDTSAQADRQIDRQTDRRTKWQKHMTKHSSHVGMIPIGEQWISMDEQRSPQNNFNDWIVDRQCRPHAHLSYFPFSLRGTFMLWLVKHVNDARFERRTMPVIVHHNHSLPTIRSIRRFYIFIFGKIFRLLAVSFNRANSYSYSILRLDAMRVCMCVLFEMLMLKSALDSDWLHLSVEAKENK